MNKQASLWQYYQPSVAGAELCNALYERELRILAQMPAPSAQLLQQRLKSLPHYIKRTAHLMLQVQSPLTLDIQNACWTAKQSAQIPLSKQTAEDVKQWYLSINLTHGLVVPIAVETRVVLDCIDRIDLTKQGFRTNAHGWFSLEDVKQQPSDSAEAKTICTGRLLKPTQRVMTAACSGHQWRNEKKLPPLTLSLRELLLSCAINWRNFKSSITF